jgi:hypothetical protein
MQVPEITAIDVLEIIIQFMKLLLVRVTAILIIDGIVMQ